MQFSKNTSTRSGKKLLITKCGNGLNDNFVLFIFSLIDVNIVNLKNIFLKIKKLINT